MKNYWDYKALQMLSQKDEWKNDLIIKELSEKIKPLQEDLLKQYLTPLPAHLIPNEPASLVLNIFHEGLKI